MCQREREVGNGGRKKKGVARPSVSCAARSTHGQMSTYHRIVDKSISPVWLWTITCAIPPEEQSTSDWQLTDSDVNLTNLFVHVRVYMKSNTDGVVTEEQSWDQFNFEMTNCKVCVQSDIWLRTECIVLRIVAALQMQFTFWKTGLTSTLINIGLRLIPHDSRRFLVRFSTV